MKTADPLDSIVPFSKGSGSTTSIFVTLFLVDLFLFLRWPSVWTGILFFLGSLLLLFVLWFFRDPNRPLPTDPNLVVGPGDGEVVEIVTEHESDYLDQEVIRISMFLSVFNVHVQRAPVGGDVLRVEHHPGQFLKAFEPEASQVNEYIGMVIKHPRATILVKQIAGFVARRCVNNYKAGDTLMSGQRFGLIKFGSRCDLFLPTNSDILVKVGDPVKGGVTGMARLK